MTQIKHPKIATRSINSICLGLFNDDNAAVVVADVSTSAKHHRKIK